MSIKSIFKKLILLGIAIVLIAVGCLLFLVSLVYVIEIARGSLPAFEFEDAQELFATSEDEFIIVANLLEKSEIEEIFIGSEEDFNKLDNLGLSENELKLLKDTRNKLIKDCGVMSIVKQFGNVNFQMWSSRGSGRGITYVFDYEEAKREKGTLLEPLDQENWYFYAHD